MATYRLRAKTKAKRPSSSSADQKDKARHLEQSLRESEARYASVTKALILILSNVNMPGMSGLELLPKARAARPDVPIIMITAYGDADTKGMALERGAEALLTKPIDFVLLRNEIETRVGTTA
jgi:DNA-binding response OmpR family regulator